MTYTAILLPVFAQVLLTFVVLFWLGHVRGRALKARQVADRDGAVLGDERVWPVGVRQASACFRNQFEIPVLFYALSTLVLVTRKADFVYIILAWVFVITRWIHAGVHVGPNIVGLRFAAYAVGVFALLVMWLLFALAILLAPIMP